MAEGVAVTCGDLLLVNVNHAVSYIVSILFSIATLMFVFHI